MKNILQVKNKIGLASIVMLVLSACGAMTKEAYIEKVQTGDSYNKTVLTDGYKIRVGVRPATYLALQELRNTGDITKKRFKNKKSDFDNGVYIDFSISLENGQKLLPQLVSISDEYAAFIGELNYMAKDNLYAYNSGDTITALYCNYTNTYNNSKELRLTYCFPRKAIDKIGSGDICFEYRDELFGLKQKASFCFDKNEITDDQVQIKGIE